MNSELHSPRPSTSSSMRRRQHDTGFPEPFNGLSNTTLPHPEANISPNAVISQDDIDFDKFVGRQRRSFRQKHKRTISHGRITAQMEAMYSPTSPISEVGDVLESPIGGGPDGMRSRSGSSTMRPLNSGVMSISTRPSTSKDGDSVFSQHMAEFSPTTSTGSSQKKRGSMLRKFRFFS